MSTATKADANAIIRVADRGPDYVPTVRYQVCVLVDGQCVDIPGMIIGDTHNWKPVAKKARQRVRELYGVDAKIRHVNQ